MQKDKQKSISTLKAENYDRFRELERLGIQVEPQLEQIATLKQVIAAAARQIIEREEELQKEDTDVREDSN